MSLIGWVRSQGTALRLAQLAVFIAFLATARSYGEVLRLGWAAGPSFGFAAAAPYLIGGNIGLGFTWAAVLLYFAGRHRLTIAAVALMTAALIVYKAMAIGLG